MSGISPLGSGWDITIGNGWDINLGGIGEISPLGNG